MVFRLMSGQHLWRSVTAVALIVSFVFPTYLDANPVPAGRAKPSSPARQSKYDNMSLAELRQAANALPLENLELTSQYHKENAAVFDESNRLVSQKVDWLLDILDKESEIASHRNAQNQLSEDAMRDGRGQMFPQDQQRIEMHEETIRRLKAEIAQLQQQAAQTSEKLVELTKRSKPALDAAQQRLAAAEAANLAERRLLGEVAQTKFGRDALWRVEPVALPQRLPSESLLPDTVARGIPRPPGNTFALTEPPPESRLGYLWRTLKRGLVDVVYEKIPNFAGAAQRALLIAFEDGRAKVREYLLRQGRVEIDAALAGETVQVRAEVSRAVEAVVESHAGRVAAIAVDQGNVVVNSQSAGVKETLGRGRFMSEWWEKVKTSVKEGRAGRFLYGVNVLFITVGVWDIGNALANGNYAQAAGIAAAFVVISGGLQLGSSAGPIAALTASGAGALLLVVGLVDMISRATSFISETIDAYNERPYVRFILDGEPCVMDGPQGQKIDATGIGFFNFPMSPAYGLTRENWFLQYPTRETLFQALREYRTALAHVFQGQWNVPPMFDPGDNMVMFEKLVGREWTAKWKESRDKTKAELDKLQAEMAARAAGISYPVQGLTLPDPTGHIFSILMSPENPTVGSEVVFRQIFGVTGLPGDKLNVTARSEVVKAGGGAAGVAPQLDSRGFDLAVAQGIKVYAGQTRMTVPAAGDYEYVVNLDFDKTGVRPEPRRLAFHVEAPEIATPCGFNFDGHQTDGALEELRGTLDAKLRAAIPSLPLFDQSKSSRDGKLLLKPSSGRYDVDDGGLVPIGGGTKESFSLRWSIQFILGDPFRRSYDEDMKSTRQYLKGELARSAEITDGPLGPNSWMGAGATRGTLDPASYGDPYASSAQVRLYDCFDIEVYAGLFSSPSGAHGARNKPEVMTAMKTLVKKTALATATVLQQNAAAALQEVIPLMKERARIVSPTPGTYAAHMEKDADNPERTATFVIKAGAGGTYYEFEGEVTLEGKSYPIKGTWGKAANEMSGRLSSPGTDMSEWCDGTYLQYGRAFRFRHGWEVRNAAGVRLSRTYEYFCRFVEK